MKLAVPLAAVRLLAAEDQSELYSVAFQLRPGGPAARLPLTRDSLILPLHHLLTEADQDLIVGVLRSLAG